MKSSSRKLTIAEYFEQIQREYLITEFRRKIYPLAKDKGYFTRVAKYKKRRIDDIANRNYMNSIFNDDLKRQEIKLQLFDSNGYPKFDMTDEDRKNYFLAGSDFVFEGNIYKVVSVDGEKLTLTDGTKNFTTTSQKEHRIL